MEKKEQKPKSRLGTNPGTKLWMGVRAWNSFTNKYFPLL